MHLCLKDKIQKSPLFKTIINIFSIFIFSILSGAFVTEITINNSLNWGSFYKTKSFYFLILASIFIYFYFRFQIQIDESIEKFKDNDYCTAYMRSQCLPELAQKVNESIRKGNDALRDIMSDLHL